MKASKDDGTRWEGVGFGLSLGVLATLNQYKLPPVLQILLERYDYDRVLAGGFMSVYALVGLLLSVPAGRALDRFGFRLVEAACALFAAGSLLTLAWPESGALVLVGRALEGVGYTLLAIAGPALANRSAGPAQVGFVAGIMATWVPVGQLVANGIALPFANAGNWQAVWLAALAFTLAVFLWSRRMRRRGVGFAPPPNGGRPGALGQAERRSLVLASLVFLLFSGQYIGFMSWLNQYLVAAQGLSAAGAVGAASVAAGAVLVFNVLTGAAFRAGLPLAPAFVGSLVIEAAAWLAVPHVEGLVGLGVLALYGVACGVTPVCLFAMPALIVGRERVGAGAFGVLMRGRNVGVLAGPLLVPLLLERLGGWDTVWPVFGALTLGAGLGAAWLATHVGRDGAGQALRR
ncbi:MAG: MFS transporter [Alphaproteobacteria bacterium]